MARLSSHTLNGVNGTHAGGIAVKLRSLGKDKTLFQAETDSGGRLSKDIDLSSASSDDTYELTFATGQFWSTQSIPRDGPQIMDEIVFRFQMPDPDGTYHLPVIINPNGYSCWWSS